MDHPWFDDIDCFLFGIFHGCFMDFLVFFLVIWWVLCLFRCLKHSALGKMPCATICCTCKKQLTARTNSTILDTGIHLEVRLKKKNQHRADCQWKKTTKNIFLTFRTTFLVGEILGNSSAFGPFLWRNYPEGRTPSPITQPEPWGNSGRVSPISQGTSRNNYESKKSLIQTASVEFSDRSWISKLALTCRKSVEIISKIHLFT